MEPAKKQALSTDEQFILSACRLFHHLPWCKASTTGPRYKAGRLLPTECNCGLLEMRAARGM